MSQRFPFEPQLTDSVLRDLAPQSVLDWSEAREGASERVDLAICTGCLEKLEADRIDDTLAQIHARASNAFFMMAMRPANTLLENGDNPNRTIRPAAWWKERLESVFGTVHKLSVPDRESCAFITWPLSGVGSDALAAHRLKAKRTRSRLRLTRRLTNRLALLRRPSLPEKTLFARAAGASVAVVGNATSLSAQDHGARIDAHDIVVRFNMMPLASARSHGRRTDWLVTHLDLTEAFVMQRGVSVILWLGDDYKLIPGWMLGGGLDFARIEKASLAPLARTIGAPPSSGLALIDRLTTSGASRISLFGFDFMRSETLSSARPVESTPHDFAAEARYILDLVERSETLTLY